MKVHTVRVCMMHTIINARDESVQALCDGSVFS